MISPAVSLASLPESQRLALLRSYDPDQLLALQHDWRFWARPEQLPPLGDWLVWLLLTGRGWGKTRTGAQWAINKARDLPGSVGILISKTPADARDVMVANGSSSILKVSHPAFVPSYEPSKLLLTWPNGSTAHICTGENPDKVRGYNAEWAWCDELAAWQYPDDTWDQLMFALRSGVHPQVCLTTTPKPLTLLRRIAKSPTTRMTTGSTYDNRMNLAASFFGQVAAKYEGTMIGQQELHGILLEEFPGALWTRKIIEAYRRTLADVPEPLLRTVVALDPSATATEDSDECGIIVASRDHKGHAWVHRDASARIHPDQWARKAVALYREFKADRIVAETNNGGEMVELTLRTVDRTVSYRGVHAQKSKEARAEPVAALYEQGLVHHVGGELTLVEDELCTWVPGNDSPNRLDALVWALTDLMLHDYEIAAPLNITSPNQWAI